MLVKIHEAYRKVVAVCDSEILGKKFVQGNMQLDLNPDFYGGKKFNEEQIASMLQELREDDATFNIVGKKSVNAALKAGIIDKEGISKIQGIPFTLSLI
jgi:hypothetical protein